MTELHLPWLELAIFLPVFGGLLLWQMKDPDQARKWSLVITGLTFLSAFSAWQDFGILHVQEAEDRWHVMSLLFGFELFSIDHLNAPLLPLVALLHTFTIFTTLRTKLRRFSFARSLFSLSLTLALFSCKVPWGVIVLAILSSIPPYFELRERGRPTRVYVLHMATSAVLLVVGWFFVLQEGWGHLHTLLALIPLLLAAMIRAGIAPFHCWLTDLFEHASFGTALLYVLPLTGAYLAVRLVLPVSPAWILRGLGILALVTAVYASGMSLIQKRPRRFFAYLFLSHSTLVLVGLDAVTEMGLTGALCVWLSVGMALGGFGLTLRAVESRLGRLTLTEHHGLYEHMPHLAMFFLLTGLASVGFPGTFGFVGGELLVDGVVQIYPYVGVAVVIAGALNGIAIVQAYLILFTGKRHQSTVSLRMRARERFAVLALSALILLGGLLPQQVIASRHHAAEELLVARVKTSGEPLSVTDVDHDDDLDDDDDDDMDEDDHHEHVHRPEDHQETKSVAPQSRKSRDHDDDDD